MQGLVRILFIMISLTLTAAPVMAEEDSGKEYFCDSENESNRDAFAGKPISLTSGAESFVRTDLAIGNVYPIVVTRRYNSRSSYDSTLGYGWALNYDKRLYTYPDGSVTIRKECGWKKRFTWDSGSNAYVSTIPTNATLSYDRFNHFTIGFPKTLCFGSPCIVWPGHEIKETYYDRFETPRDKTDSLVRNDDGTYTVTDKYGEQEDYDINGRIVSQTALNGNSHFFTYASAPATDPFSIMGLLLSNLDQNNPLVVVYDNYRLLSIQEYNASGLPTGIKVEFHYDLGTGWLDYIVDNTGRSVTYKQDRLGNLKEVKGPHGSAVYDYNNSTYYHRITNINEGQGEYVNVYEDEKRLVTQTHGGGETKVTYAAPYSNATVTATINDASGGTLTQTRAVQFDSQGAVVQATDTYDNKTIYTREEHGWITNEARYDSNNTPLASTSYTYDHEYVCATSGIPTIVTECHSTGGEVGNMTSKTDSLGNITTWTYHPVFNKVETETVKSVVDPSQNRVITNTYDEANGNLLSTATTGFLADGSPVSYTTVTTSYGYDSNGKITSIDGPRTDVLDKTTFTYDPLNGNLLTMTGLVIGTTTYSGHDGLGNPTKITDPNGNIISIEYDGLGRVSKVQPTQESTKKTEYAYVPAGTNGAYKIASITLPEGNKIYFEYDDQGNLKVIKDGLNNTINYTYDSEGNKLSEDIKDTSGVLKTHSLQYDKLNRLQATLNPGTSYTYDALGNRQTAVNPNGNTTTYNYDALNRLGSVAVTRPGNFTTTYGYNTNSNLTTVIDVISNQTTTYNYDDMGNVYQVISPDTGTTTYAYDKAGNLTSKTDNSDITITYAYNAANQLKHISSPSVNGLSAFSITYTYGTPASHCGYGVGRLCTMSDASGTTDYEYTRKGQVAKESKTISGRTYVTQYSYDQNGNIATMTYPSGMIITYTPDAVLKDRIAGVKKTIAAVETTIAHNIGYYPFGGMSAITYGNEIATAITYDNQYRLATLQVGPNGSIMNYSYGFDSNGNIISISGQNKSFGYDELDRLTTVNGSVIWTYDGVGNRLAEGETVYSYSPGTNKLSGVGGLTYSPDGNGNTISDGARGYTYNQNQRLIQAVMGSTTANYTYNGNGQRVRKVVGATTTIYHYGLNGQLIGESNIDGSFAAEHVYLNGQPLAKLEEGSTYYYHNDHLGTPQKMTDASGTVQWSADYKPFGETINITGSITNNLRFPGQYYDVETGLHYNYFRDYNPAIGRYVEADPIGMLGGDVNQYVYVSSNPLYWVDPEGLDASIIGNFSPLIPWLPIIVPAAAVAGPAITITTIAAGLVILVPSPTADDPTPIIIKAGAQGKSGGSCAANSKKHTPEQQQIIQQAKNAKKGGGLTPEQAASLVNRARNAGLGARGPESHPGRKHGSNPHVHIGSVSHIPVN